MRRPIRNKGQTAQSQNVTVKSLSAPIRGWNARDSIANMNVNDAVYLRNFFPTTVDCELRGGNSDHATTITGTVETLAVYNKSDGNSELYAISDTDVYDASSPGAAVAQTLTVTDGKYQYINFSDGTSNWLCMVNGVDTPKFWNGATWTEVIGTGSPAITGITTTDIVNITEFQSRIYFIENDSLSFWYLPADAVGGLAVEFQLGSYASKGGYLMWADSWTFDGGNGPDDYICFMTSEGQAIVYSGNDPSSNFVLIGVFDLVGRPLGRRSHIKYEGDLIALTEAGAFPLSSALKSSITNDTVAVTDKINQAFTAAARNYGTNFGWEMIIYPLRNALIFNIPTSEVTGQEQYVMNTITKAWCQFNSWDAQCFAVFNGELYFGKSTKVQKSWTGRSDDGNHIVGEGKTAFNYFDEMSQEKRFNLFRPMLQTNGDMTFLTGFDIDFDDNPITGVSSFSTTGGSNWGVGVWGGATWSSTLSIVRKWTSPSDNVGYAAAGKLKVNTNSLEVHWVANDYVYEIGGVL